MSIENERREPLIFSDCQKRAVPFFDKRVFASTRAFSRIKCAKTHSGPTSTVGSAEASSSGPRPAQSIFRDVHAQRKSPWGTPPRKMYWTLFAACGPRTLRGFFDRLLPRGKPRGIFRMETGLTTENVTNGEIKRFVTTQKHCMSSYDGQHIISSE